MANIKLLKDTELIGGQDNTPVYPISTTQAIYSHDDEGNVRPSRKHPGESEKLEERLEEHEADALDLHKKAERLVASLDVTITPSPSITNTVEITGTTNVMALSGSAKLESYGDAAAETVPIGSRSNELYVMANGSKVSIVGYADGNYFKGTYNIPNTVGTYRASYECVYNEVTSLKQTPVYANLRKYFGFASAAPSDPVSLGISDFSNSVNCTVTIPVEGTGFKRIYFAVPNNMSITNIIQPDSLNAPLAFSYVGTISRTISGIDTPYTYKLYQSDDLIDSSISKRLTIS